MFKTAREFNKLINEDAKNLLPLANLLSELTDSEKSLS